MAKNLLIVESPAKAKTLKKFLGKDFDIEASFGHIIDLPDKTLGIDLEHGFAPKYVPIKSKSEVIAKIRKKAEKAKTVYLSPDPDREGEAIAWHLQQVIKDVDPQPKMVRAVFNEITPKAVKAAVEHPRELNAALYDAQQARRVLDRLVGYKISPILWKKVRRGLSAGRVQSVALRLVVERDAEIKAFVPREYWTIDGSFKHKNGDFKAQLVKVDGKKVTFDAKGEASPPLGTEAESRAIVTRAQAVKGWKIGEVERREMKRSPKPPFITSTLQQDAARRYKYPAKKTMGIAQELYEGVELGEEGAVGLITYMRTDSVRISDDALTEGRAFIEKQYGANYLPDKPRVFKTNKNAQDAHEAIRPTYLDKAPSVVKDFLSRDQLRMYQLIWDRFIASQMMEAVLDQTTVTVQGDGLDFRASGSVVKFPGFLAVYDESKPDDEETEEDGRLPEMHEGDAVKPKAIDPLQHFTKPKPFYTEASLIKMLEEKGIGRPSTYAAILSTLTEKKYVDRVDRRLQSTALGQTVVNLLIESFATVMDVGFTAEMENRLDKVETGDTKYVDLVGDFYKDFAPSLAAAESAMPDLRGAGVDTGLSCPKCGSPVKIKLGRAGEFLACSSYPECKYTSDFERQPDGSVVAVESKREPAEDVGKCPDCADGRLLVKRTRRGNRFIACSRYPDCKHAKPYLTEVPCPECKEGFLAERAGPRKTFWGCSRYPKCKHASWDRPIKKPCPKCAFPYVVEKFYKGGVRAEVCPNKDPKCDYRHELPAVGEAEAVPA